jgi:chorismate-pyruvate lyase
MRDAWVAYNRCARIGEGHDMARRAGTRIGPGGGAKPDWGRHNLLACGIAIVAAMLLAACATAPPQRTDDRLARTGLLALLQTLNADLLSHDSATLTLERWCADHHLAQMPRIVVQRVHDMDKAIPADLQARLAIDAGPPRYRQVRLVCGERVLSEADNWYVPGMLTAQMNEQLDTSDEPFGKVVKPLGFQRRTLSAELLWSPLPAGWEMPENSESSAASPLRIPSAVLRHRAILYSAAGIPFSAVVETYTNHLFEFDGWTRYIGD